MKHNSSIFASLSLVTGKQSVQKFSPHYGAKEKSSVTGLIDSQSTIPRQRFVLLCLNNTKVMFKKSN